MTLLKKILRYNNFLSIYLFVILLFNLFLIQLPLTKVFGYEFSALNSMLLVFLSGLYFIPLIKNLKANFSLTNKFKHLILSSIVPFLLLPFLVSAIHSFLTISCSFIDGTLFYLVITFPSVLIGYALAMVSVISINKFNRIFFIIIYLLILSIPLFEFYFNPQIYFFNPIFGFYPGTIYDEGISVTWKLLEYRILNVIYFSLIVFSLLKVLSTKKFFLKSLILFLIFIIPIIFIFISPNFGFSTTFKRLNSELKGTAISKHFVIHYPANLDENFVKAIAVYHEYYYSELTNFFGYDFQGKIDSYLFSNNDQKKELFGTANADVAKPWLNCSFTTYSDYDETLKHELAHCYSSEFGSGIFKVASGINPYLIEGIAVAADPVYNDNDINYMASLAYNNGVRPNIEDLFDYLSFFTNASSVSYIYAGSFVDYLINKFGIEKFEIFYKTGNFQTAYKVSLNNILKNFYSSLIDSSLSSRKDEANFYFGRSSIFYKICPRHIADLIQIARRDFSQKNFSKAKDIFYDILKTTNNYSAVIGYADCLVKLNQADEARNFINKYLDSFKNSAYYYSLELKLGDLFSLENNFNKADSLYRNIIDQNPNRTYFYLANLRHDLVMSDSLLIPYIKGNDFDKYNILEKINSSKYDYYSIPVLIDLAKSFEMDYDLFMKNFQNRIEVNDYASSFAMYKLSNYLLVHLDFKRARKIAALAERFDSDKNFRIILDSNYKKADWFYKNYSDILNNLKIYQSE